MSIPRRSRAPSPWNSARYRNHDLMRTYRALWEHRERASAWYPHVLAGACITSAYGNPRVLTIGSLVHLWEVWDFFRGRCAGCDDRVVAVGGGGLLSTATILGVCTDCGLVQGRRLSGIGETLIGVSEALEGTGYRVHKGGARTFGPLLAVLAELGTAGLPRADSAGLRDWDPGARRKGHGKPRSSS